MPCFNHRVDPEGGGPYVGVVSAYIEEEVELELDVEDEELLLPPAALSFSSTPFSKREMRNGTRIEKKISVRKEVSLEVRFAKV